MLALEPQIDGQQARDLSAELKGLVTETSRVHDQNRLLVRQELSFLDHLMRVLSGTPQSGYSPAGLERDAADRQRRQRPRDEHLDLLRPADRAVRHPRAAARARRLGHNIANANTRRLHAAGGVMAASPAFSYPSVVNSGIPGQIGTGVDVTAYRRVRDAFVDIQLRAQSTRQGNYEAKSDGLDQVELALAEPGDTGLNSLLEQVLERVAGRRQRAREHGHAAGARAGGRRARRRVPHAQLAARRRSSRRPPRTSPPRSARPTRSAARSSTSTCRSRTRPRSATRRTTCSTSATCSSTGSRSSATSRRRPAPRRDRRHLRRRDARHGRDLLGHARRERPHQPLAPASSPALVSLRDTLLPGYKAQLDAIASAPSRRRTRCTTRATT